MKKDPFKPYIHESNKHPYPHADYDATAGKIHLKLDEAEFLAQKRNIDLKPGSNIGPGTLNVLLNR